MLKILLLIISISISFNSIATKDNIINNLTPFFGIIDKDDVIATDFKGVYEVIAKNPITSLFVSANGRYLIEGRIIDLKNRAPIALSNRINNLKRDLINTIREQDKIIFKAKNERYVVHVFTDVDCPFCAKLHAQMQEMNDAGITIKYLASPLAQLHPNAQSKMEKIWCADNKAMAMNNYKKRKIIPNSKPCDNPVAKQLKLAKKLGVNGTPALFLPNGRHIAGYMSTKSLIRELQK